jgi:hypothetical protein
MSRVRALILVEGVSDRVALETLAGRREIDLAAERISIVPMGGAQAIGRWIAEAPDVRLAGLCDANEERVFRRALARAGLDVGPSRGDMEAAGFFACIPDLEGELIRAVGAATAEAVVAAHGDLGPFRTLQKEPEWRGRPVEDQLRRFMGSGGRRKIRYARFLVEALDLARVPRPLDAVLAHARL